MLPIWMISRVGGTNLRSLDIDFEGLRPSDGTILGKRQPPFFTPREKLTQIRPYLGSRSARNTFSGPTWERKGRCYFLAIFLLFFRDLYAQRGHRGEGRLKEGVGGGLIDLKNLRSQKISNYVVQNKTGQFFSSQNEENWIDFSGLGDRF